MKNGRDYLKIGLIIFVIAAGIVLQSKKTAPLQSKAPTPQTPPVAEKTTFVTHIEVPPVEEAIKKNNNCEDSLLKKMARGCDRYCMARAVKEKDPDLWMFLENEGMLPKGFGPVSQYKLKSRLARFYFVTLWQSSEEEEDILKIFRELAAEDKDNAFPAFHLAARLMDNNKTAEAEAVLKEALKRPSYVNYVTDYHKRLKQLTVHDDSLYASALHFINQEMTLTDPSSFYMLGNFGESTKLAIARKITAPIVANEGKGVFLNWNPLDFAFAEGWIEEHAPTEAIELERIYQNSEHEKADYQPVPYFDCDEKKFHDHRIREQERLLSLK